MKLNHSSDIPRTHRSHRAVKARRPFWQKVGPDNDTRLTAFEICQITCRWPPLYEEKASCDLFHIHPCITNQIYLYFIQDKIMAWRNQGITGSNNIPLGRRRMGGEEGEEESRTATPSSMPSSMGPDGPKRGRSPARGEFSFAKIFKNIQTNSFLF